MKFHVGSTEYFPRKKLIKFANISATISTVSSTPPTTPTTQMPGDMKRTVVFMQKVSDGKEVFIRGGIDHIYKPSCTFDAATSECAIPISVTKL